MGHLLPDEHVTDLTAYRQRGGGAGLERALEMAPDEVIAEVRESGLRGRGGAGFPAGIKWAGAASEPSEPIDTFVVCNAAEGEPATFKDRAIIRRDPFQVVEGLAIAAYAIGAREAYIGIKEKFGRERTRLDQAAEEMASTGMLDHVVIRIVPGPDDYLFGVETGMLEVIEGRDPLPRLYPPYVQGLFTGPEEPSRPTVVNNVETLANVPHILARGVDWYRSLGTEGSPGTMVFTVCGDVRRETVAELEMGTPLSYLIFGAGEGLTGDHPPLMAISGVSNRPLANDELEMPLSFEAMSRIGSGLGAGGFVVYDQTACVAEIAAVLSTFLADGSCGQCPPCKLGTTSLAERFWRLVDGTAEANDIEEAVAWTGRVTDANRCGLGAGQRNLANGLFERFADRLVACLSGGCPGHRGLTVPMLDDWDEAAGRFTRAV